MSNPLLSRIGVALLAALIPACGSLPTSGPSRAKVETSGIRVIDVNYSLARHLLERHPQRLFSEVFPDSPANPEIIGPGDILEISIWEAPPAVLFSAGARESSLSETTGGTTAVVTTLPQQMVGSDGTIYVPFAGSIDVVGKSLKDTETEVVRQLQNQANRPQVLVRRVANNTSYVTVVGEVTSSTRMPLTPRGEHLLDALAAAGGTKAPIEKVTLQVTRGPSVHSLPLGTVIRDPRQNIALQSGDVVTALYQPLSFTALGATGKSDEVNFEAGGISLSQALARVGGLMDSRSNAQGVFIFRFETPDESDLNRKAMLTADGKVPIVYRIDLQDPRSFFVAQNFPMENKDVLYVANASGAELQKFLNLLLSTIYPIDRAISLTK
jgi:polysaccharide export outer membrane protein